MDLEEELLELGGLSSKATKKGKGGKKRSAAVRSDSESSAEEEVSDDENVAGDLSDDEEDGRSARQTSMPLKKRMALAESDDEDEEMSLEEELRKELGFGADLYENDEDRKRLKAMTELDRELILSERAEKRDELMQQRELQQRQRQKEREEAAANQKVEKRKTRESRAAPRRDSGAKDSALKELRAIHDRKAQDREEKSKKQKKKALDDDDEPSEAEPSSEEDAGAKDSEGEDSDEDGLSDDEPAARRSSRRGRRGDSGSEGEYEEEDHQMRDAYLDEEEEEYNEDQVNLEVLETVRVPRDKLIAWHKESFFEEAMIGAFVRVAIGMGRDGKGRYILAEVLGVVSMNDAGEDLPSYEFPTESKRFTNKHLHLIHGKDEKKVDMMSISNNPPLEGEFHDLLRRRDENNIAMITMDDVKHLQKKLENASEYRYTHEEVQRLVEKKRNQRGSVIAAAREKDRLVVERERALLEGDELTVEQYDQTISQLEQYGNRQSTNVAADINRRNKIANVKKDFNQDKANQEHARNKGQTLGALDPFARARTSFTSYWTTNSTADFEAKLQADKAAKAEALKVTITEPEAAQKESEALPPTPFTASDNVVIDAHMSVNLNVDITKVQDAARRRQDVPAARCRLPAVPTVFTEAPQGYRKLSLNDYRARQGLVEN